MQQRLNLCLEGDAKFLFQQPLLQGGLGFCPPANAAPYAFLAGFAATCLAFKASNYIRDKKGCKEGWLLNEFENCLSRHVRPFKLDWPEEKALANFHAFATHFGDTDKRKRSDYLQGRLIGTFQTHQRAELKKTLQPETVSRMESRANRNSALIWKAYPLTQDFALTDEEMRFSVAYATGQRLPHMPERCSCARETPLTMEHTVNCAEKLTRHNMIQDRFVAFARIHNVTTKLTPRLSFQDAKERLIPDIIFYPGTHAPVQTDVSVINSCAPYILGHSSQGHKWATKRRKAEKNKKYRAKAVAQGDMFRPLVFETHGKMAEEVKTTLDMLASRTTMSRGLATADMRLDLAITLARGNAVAAKTTIGRAQFARDSNRATHQMSANNSRRSNNRSRAASAAAATTCSSSSSSSGGGRKN